jgi:hypothetical protein
LCAFVVVEESESAVVVVLAAFHAQAPAGEVDADQLPEYGPLFAFDLALPPKDLAAVDVVQEFLLLGVPVLQVGAVGIERTETWGEQFVEIADDDVP